MTGAGWIYLNPQEYKPAIKKTESVSYKTKVFSEKLFCLFSKTSAAFRQTLPSFLCCLKTLCQQLFYLSGNGATFFLASCLVATPITLPISCGPVAPTSAMIVFKAAILRPHLFQQMEGFDNGYLGQFGSARIGTALSGYKSSQSLPCFSNFCILPGNIIGPVYHWLPGGFASRKNFFTLRKVSNSLYPWLSLNLFDIVTDYVK